MLWAALCVPRTQYDGVDDAMAAHMAQLIEGMRLHSNGAGTSPLVMHGGKGVHAPGHPHIHGEADWSGEEDEEGGPLGHGEDDEEEWSEEEEEEEEGDEEEEGEPLAGAGVPAARVPPAAVGYVAWTM
jgi:hypothetical protein